MSFFLLPSATRAGLLRFFLVLTSAAIPVPPCRRPRGSSLFIDSQAKHMRRNVRCQASYAIALCLRESQVSSSRPVYSCGDHKRIARKLASPKKRVEKVSVVVQCIRIRSADFPAFHSKRHSDEKKKVGFNRKAGDV